MYLNGIFANTQGVPELDGLVPRSGYNLTVVCRESDTQHILRVSNKPSCCLSSVETTINSNQRHENNHFCMCASWNWTEKKVAKVGGEGTWYLCSSNYLYVTDQYLSCNTSGTHCRFRIVCTLADKVSLHVRKLNLIATKRHDIQLIQMVCFRFTTTLYFPITSYRRYCIYTSINSTNGIFTCFPFIISKYISRAFAL